MAQPADQAHATDDFDDAIDQLRADYDMTPYTSNSFPQSAPGQLAAIAICSGWKRPRYPARVLEIGCAAGGNLIPFAAAHPQAHTVGIDLSQVQVDQGRTRAQALGLNNLELLAGDIARMNLAALGHPAVHAMGDDEVELPQHWMRSAPAGPGPIATRAGGCGACASCLRRFQPSADLADHIDDLMGVLIMQGAAQVRLDPVLPEPAPAHCGWRRRRGAWRS